MDTEYDCPIGACTSCGGSNSSQIIEYRIVILGDGIGDSSIAQIREAMRLRMADIGQTINPDGNALCGVGDNGVIDVEVSTPLPPPHSPPSPSHPPASPPASPPAPPPAVPGVWTCSAWPSAAEAKAHVDSQRLLGYLSLQKDSIGPESGLSNAVLLSDSEASAYRRLFSVDEDEGQAEEGDPDDYVFSDSLGPLLRSSWDFAPAGGDAPTITVISFRDLLVPAGHVCTHWETNPLPGNALYFEGATNATNAARGGYNVLYTADDDGNQGFDCHTVPSFTAGGTPVKLKDGAAPAPGPGVNATFGALQHTDGFYYLTVLDFESGSRCVAYYKDGARSPNTAYA